MHQATVLQANLLGSPIIQCNPTTPLAIPRLQTRALFFRLAVHLQPVARDHLCYLFWPDTSDREARRNLTLLLSHLRRALPAPELMQADTDQVQMDRARVASDSATFARLCDNPSADARLANLERAIALYRGPLLSGFAGPADCPEYNLWLDGERRTFERLYLDGLTTLIEACMARGKTAEAIHYARRYLEADDLAEDVHRQLMQLYLLAGDRAAARRQFEACAAILERELGVTPLPETATLYHAILDGRLATTQAAPREPVWATLAGPAVPLVGRAQARQRLQQAYEQAAAGHGGIALLVGEAGIGKSRLMQEVATHLPGPVSIFTAASHPGVQSIPYYPVIEALRPAIQDAAVMAAALPDWLSVASLLFPEIRGLYPQLPTPVWQEPEQARGQIFEALCQLLWVCASRGVVLLCLDDLHWADSATLDWLSYLARHLPHRRLLVLGACRSEDAHSLSALRDRWRRLHVLTEIPLSPLDVAEVQQLLTHLDQGERASNTLAARLQTLTGGNPFFLLESVQALRETGASLAALSAQAELPLSANVRTAIVQRVERLSSVARQALEAGAVLGPRFDFDTVRQTAGRRALETGPGLDELVTRRFVEEQGDGYRFCHELVQSAVYRALSGWRRQLLHRRAAQILARQHPDARDPASGRIAEHYAQGGMPQQAVSFYQHAADAAEGVYATQEAAAYLTRALTLLDNLPDDTERRRRELELLIALGGAWGALKGWSAPELEPISTRALPLAEQMGNDGQRYQVLRTLHHYHLVRAEFPPALALAKAMRDLAESSADPTLRPWTYYTWGMVVIQQGDFVQARAFWEQALALYDPHQKPTFSAPYFGYHIFMHCLAAHTLWHLGYPDQAVAHANRAAAVADEIASPFDRIVTLDYTAMLYQFRRQTGEVRERAQAALAYGAEYGFAYYLAWANILLGWAQVETGEVKEGIARMRRGLAAFDQTGAGLRKPYYLGLLAEALGKAGDTRAGLAQVDEALALAQQRGEGWTYAELHRKRGELLLAHRAADGEAEQAFQRALAIARQQQAKALELRAALSLARLWQRQGRRDAARQLLAHIVPWFSEGFDTPDWQEASHLLQQLSM